MAVPREQLTLEEFLTLPEQEPALEYEGGRITQKVSPKGKHSRLQTRLVDLVNRGAVPSRLACAFVELRTTFGGRSPVPDVAIYLWERVPLDADGEIADNFTEPPDVVAEIVSPDQSVMSLVRRCLWYVGHGVRVALLVDPSDKDILVFRPGQVPQSLDTTSQVDLSDVIPGLVIHGDQLFAALRLEGQQPAN